MRATRHFLHRAASRGLRAEVFDFIIAFGDEWLGYGMRFVTILERRLPPGLSHQMIERARGWVIVMGENDILVTCYRGQQPQRQIARNYKHAA